MGQSDPHRGSIRMAMLDDIRAGRFVGWHPLLGLRSGTPEVQISAGNRLKSYRAGRSAFLAVVLDPTGPYRESGKNVIKWRDPRPDRRGNNGRLRCGRTRPRSLLSCTNCAKPSGIPLARAAPMASARSPAARPDRPIAFCGMALDRVHRFRRATDRAGQPPTHSGNSPTSGVTIAVR